MAETPLPEELETRLMEIFEGPEGEREDAIGQLLSEHPEHAEAIRDQLSKAERVWRAVLGAESESLERVGPYRIVDVLGEGGMGTVYLAEQKEPVRRSVALKVIKQGMDTRQVLRRFAAERQALAMMEHSNIAKVFEAGSTDGGQPYFVMEYVRGHPITHHCDQHNASIDERLELFRQVCAGVQHAHLKGIMHRDLKPSNVLVTVEDSGAVPKIIDFGLARATDHRLVQSTIFTDQGLVVGTPEYMSPEQMGLAGQDVDTRTDVYSLGVLLYELLVGELPFSQEEIRQGGLREMERKIREEEPPRPSTRLSNHASSAEQAARRRTDVRTLVRRLRGDLDWIVMKAIEKDRNRRYETPAALAEDLWRHLAHLPVSAGPPGAIYRVGKFVRRYPTQVAAASIALLALVGGLLVSIGFYGNARAAAREEFRARRDAEVAIERFEQVAYVVQLDNAKREAETLFPAWPERIPLIEAWLREKAEPLEQALPGLRADLERLDAQPEPDPGTASPDGAQEFLRQTIASLVTDLEAFVAEDGLVHRVAESLSWARNVDRLSIDDHRDAWTRTIAGIRSSPRYGGLEVSPQRGLVPVGRDPDSQLFEFYHLRSGNGELPERDETGRLPGLTENSGIHFVLVPGGTFEMGAQSERATEPRYDAAATPIEGPVHRVELEPFFLAKHELTAAQWRRLGSGRLPSLYIPGNSVGERGPRQPILWTNPVESVSWVDLDEVLTRNGLSLPTEAQWEYAARAGTDTPWWTGAARESLQGAANLNDLTVVRAGIPWPDAEEWLEDGFVVHAPADALQPNPFGIHHVHGNVWEWCRDGFATYDVPPRPGDGLRSGDQAVRIIRGGGFEDVASLSRISGRGFMQPSDSSQNLGARAARPIH